MMTLQSLQELKLQAVAQLLAVAAPQMFASSQLKDETGAARRIWAKDGPNGYTDTVSLADSTLPPVHAITDAGIIQNCYGNAVLRTWNRIAIEDVLRLTEVVQAQALSRAAAAQAAPAVAEVSEAWSVKDVNVHDRLRTMCTVRAVQRTADGATAEVKFSVATKRAVCDLLPTLNKWVQGTVQTFLSELAAKGHHVVSPDTATA